MCLPSYVYMARLGSTFVIYFSWQTISEDSTYHSRTYYNPPLIAHNGHVLYKCITQPKVVMETEFELSTAKQFDQVGMALN